MRISDWSSDVCSSDLVLLLSSPVIGEIDRQKGGAGRLAKRARTANTLIRRLLDEDSVAIKTKKKGPVVVVESGNGLRTSDDLREMLDYSYADDRLVGLVLRYTSEERSVGKAGLDPSVSGGLAA